MKKYIRTLKKTFLHKERRDEAAILTSIPENEYLLVHSEKLRNKILWIEIIVDNNIGYIKYDIENVFICKYARLDDKQVTGFNYKIKQGGDRSFFDVCRLKRAENDGFTEPIEIGRKINDGDREIEQKLTFWYNKDLVEISTFTFSKRDEFYIIRNNLAGLDKFIEISDFDGLEGFIFKDTSYTYVKDKWLPIVSVTLSIIFFVAIFLFFLSMGVIVIAPVLLIPCVFLAIVIMLMVKGIVNIIGHLFYQIKIRV